MAVGERRFRYGLGAVLATLFLAYGVLMAWNGQHDRHVADRLRSGGVTVEATITDYRVPYQLKGAHEVKVAFQTLSGQNVETWVTASSYRGPGATRIRYSVANPSVARLVDDMEPRAGDLLALVIITLGLGALGFMVYRIGRSFDRTLGLGG
ncbi:MAG: hypothetical protein QOI56_2129 [Actinomycetota bacterium]|nr:hypothetical protein [Actinomycetota bacterium]